MRIAYVCHWNVRNRDGVTSKLELQTGSWRALGHDVELFALAPGGRLDGGYGYDSARARIAAARRLARDVRRYRPDVLYVRYDLFPPTLWPLLRRRPTIVEVNSDDRAELARPGRNPWARRYNEVNRRVVLAAARGFVCVTRELATRPSLASFGKPTEVIANGVDLDAFVELPPATNARPRIAFLGSDRQAWHGVDKLVELARLRPELDVDVIGYDPAAAAERYGAAGIPNLTLHGRLGRAAYEPLLARADAAAGTLAFHRIGLDEGCPLKVREYLGYGLPVLLAYDDTDLVGLEAWWLHRLPNSEENVTQGAAEIERFVRECAGRRVPRAEVAPLVGSEAKERRRLDFLERVGCG